jgi:Tfp pilus assembly protein PilF
MNPAPAARRTALGLATVAFALLSLGGCATAPPAPPAPPGLVELLERPAERALYDGLKAYDDGQYAQAEARLKAALAAPLPNRRDQASAWKLLAFMHCAAGRGAECEAAFRAALVADPSLQLSRSEAGHPLWGPVWQRLRATTP